MRNSTGYSVCRTGTRCNPPSNLLVPVLMAVKFEIDRDTPMRLPPDLRDWVPEDAMVHFMIEAVKRIDFI